VEIIDTYGLVESRNAKLWIELKSIHDIEIQLYDCAFYSAYSKNSKSIIYVPKNNISPASFTHELLHILLRTKKIFIGGGLQLNLKEKPTLSKIFTQDLIYHIGNCLDHIKMLPYFLNIGYDRKDFLTDYSINKLSNEDLKHIKNNFHSIFFFKKYYKASAIDCFVGKYFAAKACPNNALDYSIGLNKLKAIDTKLYLILEKFTNAWNDFDCNNQDPITSSYHLFLFDFIDEMENWAVGKVQNKIHFAIHGQTAAEVIFNRADAEKEFMGLMTFLGNRPYLKDVVVAKNYLNENVIPL